MQPKDDNLPGRPLDLDELEKFPERGIDILDYLLRESFCQNWRNPRWGELSQQLEEEWMDARKPLTRREGNRRLNELMYTDYGLDIQKIWEHAGKGGRPVKLRKAAIMALMWQRYLGKSMKEITIRLCPDHREHGEDQLYKCMAKFKAEMSTLRSLLDELKITLPDELPRVFGTGSTPNVEEWPHYEVDPEDVERPQHSDDDGEE
jgi:hypothetical protein